MAQNWKLRLGPVTLTTTTTTNLFNPPTTTGGTNAGGPAYPTKTYLLLKHVKVTNVLGASAKVALWIGATGTNSVTNAAIFGGSASAGSLTQGVVVAANSYIEAYLPDLRLDTADFLVGGSDTASSLVIEIEAEMGVTN